MDDPLMIQDSLHFPTEPEKRLAQACQIAGALAEVGVQELTITDPRLCATRRLQARSADLPKELANAFPGTTYACEQCSLLIDEGAVRWSAEPRTAGQLHQAVMAPPPPRPA